MKLIKRILLVVLIAGLGYGIYYAWRAFPIISGYGAKNLCSCVMVAGREPQNVIDNELGSTILSLGSFSVDYTDSSASGSVFGLAKKKAIYRKGLGCTLLSELSEQEVRDQKIAMVGKPDVPDTLAWPYGNKLPDSLPKGINYDALNKVVASAFEEPGEEKNRRTRAVIVLYDGAIVAEQYAPGFTASSPQMGWSMSKSITNALIGILVKQGKLKINDPAPVAAWKEDERKNITLNDLMHMSSGLTWEENYGGPSGATNMLFKKKDMGLYAAEVPAGNKPDAVFYYSSGTTNILSRIVRDAIGDEGYYRFPYEELFYKIGVYNMVMEPDAGGTFVGSSYSYAPARDWARFGLLYFNNGVWSGEQVLPEGWVKYTSTAAPAAPRGEYGAQFWMNAGAPGNPSNRLYPDVPTDLYWADGFEGQNVFIIPSERLVVVKLSLSQGNYLDDNAFLAGIIATLPKTQ